MKVLNAATLFCLTGLCLGGCSTIGNITHLSEVQPWERDILAKENMQLVADSMDGAVDDHIYFSREASTGGSSIAGGGCGCN